MQEYTQTLVGQITALCEGLALLDEDERMDAINAIRQSLHAISPMKEHPVDCVLWIQQEHVKSNSYNPNVVASPELKLLERSVSEDGFTQPVVVWQEQGDEYEIIDGFHRSLVSKKPKVQRSTYGRLPITIANHNHTSLSDRMASTIRHNRARGEHSIELMQNIVAELVDIGMSDHWIAQHLGMDADELLRLKQLTGLAALFKDAAFSRSWSADRADTDAQSEEEETLHGTL